MIPSISDWHSELYKVETIPTGPLEFISLIKNADFVCTDSFHGMAYSINLNIPFLVFKRNYGKASDQSSRVVSLLNILSLGDRFVNDVELNLEKIVNVDFVESNKVLSEQREKGLQYLKQALDNS